MSAPLGQTTKLNDDRCVKPVLVLTEPAYETINLCQEANLKPCTQTINNPVYGGENKPDIGYAETSNTSRGQIVDYMAGYQALDPRTTASLSLSLLTSEKKIVNQVPYLMPQQSFGKENKKERYKMQANCSYQQISDPKSQTGVKTEQSTAYINTHVVPTDSQMGYSTLLRADKIKSSSSALGSVSPLYESIKEKENCFQVGSKGDHDKVIAEISMSTTQATIISPTNNLEQQSSNAEYTSQTNESSLKTSSGGHNRTAVQLGKSTSPDT